MGRARRVWRKRPHDDNFLPNLRHLDDARNPGRSSPRGQKGRWQERHGSSTGILIVSEFLGRFGFGIGSISVSREPSRGTSCTSCRCRTGTDRSARPSARCGERVRPAGDDDRNRVRGHGAFLRKFWPLRRLPFGSGVDQERGIARTASRQLSPDAIATRRSARIRRGSPNCTQGSIGKAIVFRSAAILNS